MESCILLSNSEHFALVDSDDFAELTQWRWRLDVRGYVVRSTKDVVEDGTKRNNVVYMHRQIMKAPKGFQVDHCKMNKRDNQKKNLRLCNNSQNHRNMGKRRGCSSRFKGVSWNTQSEKWFAFIKGEGKQVYIGSFALEEDAALAYNFYAERLHGDFARFNTAEGEGA